MTVTSLLFCRSCGDDSSHPRQLSALWHEKGSRWKSSTMLSEYQMGGKLISIATKDETTFEAIRDICGDRIANRLASAAGGTRVHLPPLGNFNETSQLAALIGVKDARIVMDAVGTTLATTFYVPKSFWKEGP